MVRLLVDANGLAFAEHDLGSLQRREEKPAELRLRCGDQFARCLYTRI